MEVQMIHRFPNLFKKAILISSIFVLSLTGAMAQNIGDANNNGSIDIVDALVIAQYYVGLNPSPFASQAADVNCSGSIDIVDALLIAQYYVGLISQFPCTATPVPTPADTAAPTNPPAGNQPLYGQLQVSGGQLRSSSGGTVQLKGMSAHMIQTYPFVKGQTVPNLKTWGCTVIRAAMYTEELGYISQPALMKQRCKDIVDDCITAGIYVLIDWHILSDGNPNTHVNESKAFFQEMATTYGNQANVLYEICNEPNGVDWNTVKTYANTIIPVIRAIDPDNVIIVGTPTWSQDVDVAAASPLSYSNIMYALHFYSGTHGQSLRDKANTALNQGAAIFITEFGTSASSGTGGPYISDADTWISWANSKSLSWCNWSVTTKNETSAALKTTATMSGPWADSDLSTSGLWVKGKIGGN
jgi:endoglucanase